MGGFHSLNSQSNRQAFQAPLELFCYGIILCTYGMQEPLKMQEPPPGLEGAPPRLIPGEDAKSCFPLFAVDPPAIPTGAGRPQQPRFCGQTVVRAPVPQCPALADRPRYMVFPLCRAKAGSASIIEFHWRYLSVVPT